MFLTKKQPTYEFGRVSYSPLFDFDSLFNKVFDQLEYSYESRLKLNETDSQYTLTLELPGYSQKDLEVLVNDYILTICAKNDLRGETKREISLWEGIDFEKINGKLENGLLTVKLPKIEKIKPVKVKIE